jgi:xylan 1,4-beta-xylosidase
MPACRSRNLISGPPPLQIECGNPAATGNFLGHTVKNGSYTFATEFVIKGDIFQNIVLYGDAQNAIGYGAGQNRVELWQVKDGKYETLKTQDIPDKYKNIRLELQSRYGHFYTFSWAVKGQKIDSLTSSVQLEAPWLPRWDRAPRVGIRVTGHAGPEK